MSKYSNAFDMFDGIFVTNLEQQVNRWIQFMQQAQYYGFASRVTRIPGVKHKIGSFGCAVAMRNALQLARERGYRKLLFFQDDVLFMYPEKYVHMMLNHYAKDIQDSDIFFLGVNPDRNNKVLAPKDLNVYSGEYRSFRPQGVYYGSFALVFDASVLGILDNISDDPEEFTAHQRDDHLIYRADVDKRCSNPLMASVGDFRSGTGVHLEKEGAYTPKDNYIKIPKLYREHQLVDVKNLRGYSWRDQSDISVIIPAHKAGKYIEETLNSFQNEPVKEILVGVDNCTETLTVLEKIRDRYPKVKVFYFDKNVGPYIIRNSLVQYAESSRILFFDADDIIIPDAVAEIDTHLDRGADQVRYFFRSFKDGQGNKVYNKASDIFAYGTFATTKEHFLKVGGFQGWLCAADNEFVKRTASFAEVQIINKPMFYYRGHAGNLTRREDTGVRSKLREKYHSLIKEKYESPAITMKTHPARQIKGSGERLISANMATFPPRIHKLKKVVSSVLPHVDVLRIYLNGYTEIPDFLKHPGIVVFFNLRDIGSAGKFYKASDPAEEYYFTIDDDIEYSADYFRNHIKFLEEHPGAVVTTHGHLTHDLRKYPYDKDNIRKMICFHERNSENFRVDLVGTGVMAFDLSRVQFSPYWFEHPDTSDMIVSMICRQKGIPMWLRKHDRNELRNLVDKEKDPQLYKISLWANKEARRSKMEKLWFGPGIETSDKSTVHYLTRKEFIEGTEVDPEYWSADRWSYTEQALKLAGQLPGIKNAMEIGAFKFTLIRNGYAPGVTHTERWDANVTPWPVKDKEYDLVIGLQILEHLKDKTAVFRELRRVCRFAIISVPYNWKTKPDNCHYMINETHMKTWSGVQPAAQVIDVGTGGFRRLIHLYDFRNC